MTSCREYGNPPYRAIIVHGGPGAPGCCAGICRGQSDEVGFLEHLQEGHSIRELIEEIRDIILRYDLEKTVLIGHSWGAWLSFLFAAQHPQHVSKVILVGCGPFDVKYYPLLVAARNVKIMLAEQKEDIQAANLYSPDTEYNPDNYCHIPNLPKDMIVFNEAQYNSLMGEIITPSQRDRASHTLLIGS